MTGLVKACMLCFSVNVKGSVPNMASGGHDPLEWSDDEDLPEETTKAKRVKVS